MGHKQIKEVTLKIDRDKCKFLMENLRENGMYANLISICKTNFEPQHLITNLNDEAISYWNIIGEANQTRAKLNASCHAILHQDTTEIYNISSNTLKDFDLESECISLYDFLSEEPKTSPFFKKLDKALKESGLSEIDPKLQKNVSLSVVKRISSPHKIVVILPDFRDGFTMSLIKHDKITSNQGEKVLNINYQLDDSLNGLASTAKPGDFLVFNLDNSVYFIHQDSKTLESYEILDAYNSKFLAQAVILPALSSTNADDMPLILHPY